MTCPSKGFKTRSVLVLATLVSNVDKWIVSRKSVNASSLGRNRELEVSPLGRIEMKRRSDV